MRREDEQPLSDEEIANRMDAALRRSLQTPHKAHAPGARPRKAKGRSTRVLKDGTKRQVIHHSPAAKQNH